MKTPYLALIVATACAGAAHAQSNVTIYGALDAGLIKRSASSTAVGKRDANTLGFRGVEELGPGLKALFQLEIRYEPDTGTVESAVRPLFQGQSRVGLQGGFGTLRIGRGTTSFMDSVIAFEPFHGIPSPAGFYSDVAVAGYTSQPLDPAGNSFNRISNAAFYNSPEYNGMQINATVATREAGGGAALIGRGTTLLPQYRANAEASANPFSISATYKNPVVGAMVALERNGVESKLWSVAGSVKPIKDLKLMAIYGHQDRGHTMAANEATKAWVVGANYSVASGTVLLGYGRKEPEGVTRTRQLSIGYEYALSKRTFVYADASRKQAASRVNHLDLGMRSTF
jgi:predicted porin